MTVDEISEEVYDAMSRASELRHSTQVVSFFVSFLSYSQDLGKAMPSFMSIIMDDSNFMQQEIVAREIYITEEEKN